jgi:hypothetical protein
MSWMTARSRLAGLHARPADDPEVIAARRDLRFEMLAARVRRDVAVEPALTDEQRQALAELLRATR